MPLEMIWLPVLQRTVKVIGPDGTTWRYTTPHALMRSSSRWGTGEWTLSPGRGLCAHIDPGCATIVMHSETTKRTVLVCAIYYTDMTSFVPMLQWLTDGHDKKATALQVGVVHGFRIPDEAWQPGNRDWMHDLKQLFSRFGQNIIPDIFDFGVNNVRFGSILVDKGTGRITIPVPARDQPTPPDRILLMQSPVIPSQFTQLQKAQSVFMIHLFDYRREVEEVPISMHFGGQKHTFDLPIHNVARQLFRSGRLKEPVSSRIAILKAFNVSANWVRKPQSPRDHSIMDVFLHVMGMPAECERCGNTAVSTCSRCRGASYCGKVHQKEDWKAHKVWCESHPYPLA